jgi:hypothetical protein
VGDLLKTPRTIALDFDGVIHSYVSGWTGPTPVDPPVIGARDAIATIRALGHRVVVFSCRAETQDGMDGILGWLALHDIRVDEVTNVKPHAVLYVDDRGVRFEGSWDAIVDLARDVPRPWNAGQQLRSTVYPASAASPRCGTCGVDVYEVTPQGTYAACGHRIPSPVIRG